MLLVYLFEDLFALFFFFERQAPAEETVVGEGSDSLLTGVGRNQENDEMMSFTRDTSKYLQNLQTRREAVNDNLCNFQGGR